MRPIDPLLSRLCNSAFAVGFVFARASAFAKHSPISIPSALPAAPNAGIGLPREVHRAENSAAMITAFLCVAAMLGQQSVALLKGEQHG